MIITFIDFIIIMHMLKENNIGGLQPPEPPCFLHLRLGVTEERVHLSFVSGLIKNHSGSSLVSWKKNKG